MSTTCGRLPRFKVCLTLIIHLIRANGNAGKKRRLSSIEGNAILEGGGSSLTSIGPSRREF